jgi:putative oxidoreductase
MSSRTALKSWLFPPGTPRAALFVRALVGWVFLSEGIQKFLFPAALGVGRFTKIGIPAPGLLAPFVGIVEIAGGLFVILGLLTRLAALPLIADMIVAITATKVPLLVHQGFWPMAHEARVDVSMLLGALFLLIAGPGPISVDARLSSHRQSKA